MSIASEIRALHQRMVEDNQRDVDVMAEVANVFLRIDDARQRGYAQLARVFSGQDQQQPPPHPLQETQAALNGGVYGPSASPPASATLKELADAARRGDQYGAQPYMTQAEADAYMRTFEEAYGPPPADQYGAAEDIARRFSPPVSPIPNGGYRS